MGRKHQTTAVKVTAELDQHLNSPVSAKSPRRELNKAGYRGRAAIRKHMLPHQHSDEVEVVYRSQGLDCRPMQSSDKL